MRKLVIIFCLTGFQGFSHPGNTDSDNGHIDHNTGTYHYHFTNKDLENARKSARKRQQRRDRGSK